MTIFSRTTVAAFTTTTFAFALGAHAGLPSVLDQVPTDAVLVIATPSLSQLDNDASQVLGMLEMPDLFTPKQMLQTAGFRQGLDMNGSAAFVLLPGDFQNGEDPPVVALIPTKNYTALLDNFNAVPGANGAITSFEVEGESIFSKKVGSWAVMSPERELIQNFAGNAGAMAHFTQTIGPIGANIAEKNDVLFIANVSALDPMFDEWRQDMRQQMQMMNAFGGMGAEQAQMSQEMAEQFIKALEEDGQALVGGFDMSTLATTADFGIVFKPGSETANKLQNGGKSQASLAALPDQPFLFAGSIDFSTPATSMMVKIMEKGGGPAFAAMKGGELMKAINSQSFAVYPNSAGIMAGALANTIEFFGADNPAHVRQLFGTAMKNLNNVDMGEAAEFTKMSGVFTPDAEQINGQFVDAWGLDFTMNSPQGGGMMMDPMAMMFGPGGMGGYLATGNGGVYMTLSNNSPLMSQSLKAGRGNSLASNPTIAQIRPMLPRDLAGEMYIGIGPILDQVLPMAGMFGLQFDVNTNVPPIAMGMTAEGGAFHGRLVVPTQVLKLGASLAKQAESLQQQQDTDEQHKPRF